MKDRLNAFRIILLIFICISSFINIIFLWQVQIDKKNTKSLDLAYKEEDEKTKKKMEKNVDVTTYQNAVDSLKSEFNNTDIVGTLKINGTDIDTPFVQTDNNDFYLDHAINKSSNKLGSVFMDYRNNLDDKVKLIYGHNSKNLKPQFHELENYLKEDFAKEHMYIQIMDQTGLYNYKLFSVLVIPNDTTRHMQINFEDDESYLKHLNWIKDSSKFVLDTNISSKDKIVLLQTCYYVPENTFLVIAFKKI